MLLRVPPCSQENSQRRRQARCAELPLPGPRPVPYDSKILIRDPVFPGILSSPTDSGILMIKSVKRRETPEPFRGVHATCAPPLKETDSQADVDRAEPVSAMKAPCFGVQSRNAAVARRGKASRATASEAPM